MNLRRTSAAPAVFTSADTILRGLGAALLLAVAEINFLDVLDKFDASDGQS